MHDEVKCATKISRTEPSGAVFTEYCGRGRHADGCPLAARPSSIVKRGDDLYVNVAGTQIRLTSDPTLGQREIRFEQQVTVTRCARCSHAFTSRPADGQNVVDFTDEIAAHQERCFVVGDTVETVFGKPVIRGRIASIIARGCFAVEISTSGAGCVAGSKLAYGADALRRIPRPQQGEAVTPKSHRDTACNHVLFDAAAAKDIRTEHGKLVAYCDACIAQLDAPVLYDGLTVEQCLERYEMRQREGRDPDDSWGCARITLTPVQLAAARELWSLYLKAKVAASATAERNRVRVELQCDEDPTW